MGRFACCDSTGRAARCLAQRSVFRALLASGSDFGGHRADSVQGAVGRVLDTLDERLVEELHERALTEAVEIPEAALRGIDRAVQQT